MIKSVLVVALICCSIFSVAYAGGYYFVVRTEGFADAGCTQSIGEYRSNVANSGTPCPYDVPTVCKAAGANYVIKSCLAANDMTLPNNFYVQYYTSTNPCPAISTSYGLVSDSICMDYDDSRSFNINCTTTFMNDFTNSLGCAGSIPYTFSADTDMCTDYMGYSASFSCVAPPVDPPVAPPVNPPVDPPMTAPVAEPMAAPMAPPMAAPVAAPVAAPARKTNAASGFVNVSLAVIIGVTIALL